MTLCMAVDSYHPRLMLGVRKSSRISPVSVRKMYELRVQPRAKALDFGSSWSFRGRDAHATKGRVPFLLPPARYQPVIIAFRVGMSLEAA